MEKIRIGIVGYGNLGRGAKQSITLQKDMELVGIFTRRNLSGDAMISYEKMHEYVDKIDVMLLCGGSATDLFEQGPHTAALFNTVDTFDTHARIPEYYQVMQQAAAASDHLSLISIGWDPGLFSLNRLLGQSILPSGTDYTFWGKGVSQGHSDAIRRIDGVKNAIQYTVPVEEAIQKARTSRDAAPLSTREKHLRICYVVPEEGADRAQIQKTIQTMPNYFADYDTTVHFLNEETFQKEHGSMPHGGFVIRRGQTSENTYQRMEFQLELDSNPEFTSSVVTAYARALHKMHKKGERGARSIFDVPPALLSERDSLTLMQELL